MKKPLAAFTMVTLLLLQTPAYAINTSYDNQNTETDRVIIAQAEQTGTTYTGQGESHTTTDTRTKEQKEDDATKERIDELEALIRETIDKINSAEGGGSQNGSDLNPFPDHNPDGSGTFPDINLPDYELPDYELPDWALPDFELPDMPQWELPEINADLVFKDGEKAFDGVYVIDGPAGVVVVDQVTVPIGMIVSYVSQLNNLNDKSFPGIAQPQQPHFTIEDVEQPFTQADLDRLIAEMEEWIRNNTHIIPPDFDLPDIMGNPDIGDLDFDGSFDITPLPGTDTDVSVPNDVSSLYQVLMRYLAELQSLGKNHVNITRIAVYNTTEYAIRTIRQSTPLPEYRWEVTGENDTISTQTDSRVLKLLFRSSGTYTVRVYNTREVIRNNKVSGKKSEIWMMSNNDAMDGLVLYNSTTAFEAYLAADIGPTIEEIELIKDGFIANVTPQMVDQVQLIDADGNMRSPSDGHTTERH